MARIVRSTASAGLSRLSEAGTSLPQSVGGPRAGETGGGSPRCVRIGSLPKMRRAGRSDVSDLAVSVYSLTPVAEPLYAVA